MQQADLGHRSWLADPQFYRITLLKKSRSGKGIPKFQDLEFMIKLLKPMLMKQLRTLFWSSVVQDIMPTY
jgi:hypothetical protein